MRWMKWLAGLALAGAAACASPAADVKISAMPAASALTGSEKLSAVQGSGCATGVSPCSNVAVTPAQISTYDAANIGTGFGRSVIATTDATALRTLLGVTATGADPAYQPLDGDLTSLAAAATNNSIYYRSAANTWSPVTIGTGLSFSGGTLANTVSIAGLLTGANNLSDLPSASTARINLGLAGLVTKSPSGRWLAPDGVGAVAATPVAPGSGSIRLYPCRVRTAVTINGLAVRVTTASSSGNVQFAIYAADATAVWPTGVALYSSASVSTGTTGTASPATLSLALAPGIYWLATNSDNATAVYASTSYASNSMMSLIGSSSSITPYSTSAALTGFSLTATYGTWPTLTGTGTGSDGLVELTTGSVPFVIYKVN